MSRRAIAFLFAWISASPIRGADVWILQGIGATPLPSCQVVLWRPGVVFHNRSAIEATIRPVHVTNQEVPGTPQPQFFPQTIAAGSSATPLCCTANSTAWFAEFNVPDTLAIEGRMELYYASCAQGIPPQTVPFTKIRMPVFTRLVPAGEEQVHLGTDLGGAEVRLNVGIYNAGAEQASATITVYQPMCSTTAFKTRTVTVPADTYTQVSLSPITQCAGKPAQPQSSTAYTVVIVDQPSLSLVSTLMNGVNPTATATVTSVQN